MFEGTIQTNAGFKVSGDISFTPRSISVYASDVVLDTLKEIKTVYTEIKKGNKTVTRTVQLEKINGATLEPTSVTVTIPIEEYTERHWKYRLSVPTYRAITPCAHSRPS